MAMDFELDIDVSRWNVGRVVRLAAAALLAILLIVALFGSWYTLDAKVGEHAVIQRWGKYVGTVTDPGIHLKLPFGIDTVTVERVQVVRRVEVGVSSGGRTRDDDQDRIPEEFREPEHSVVITRDQNLVDAVFVVQFEISDLSKYLFAAHRPEWTVQQAAKAAMREVIANRDIDEILTTARDEMQMEAQEQAQKMLDAYDIGIRIRAVQFQDVHAPNEVIPAFNDVQKAKEEKETRVNEGKRYANTVIPRAEAEAAREVTAAEAYKIRRLNEATGDAARFLSLLERYKSNPALTRRQLYLQVMGEVLPGMQKTILESAPGQFILPLDGERKGDGR
jgi:membrane protease subunit HflK